MGDDVEQLDLFEENLKPPVETKTTESEPRESILLQWLFRKEGLMKANLHPTGENQLKGGENTCWDCYHYGPSSATQGYGPCAKLKAKDSNCLTMSEWPACEKFKEIIWF